MPQIVQQGSINTTALVVPDLYVQIVPPQNLVMNGVPTNVVGVVGTAIWGPVNQPVIIGGMAEYAAAFGGLQPRKYDMGTPVAIAVQQGAQSFRCVRVTDGTDVAASYGLFAGGAQPALILTAQYTGSFGNGISFVFAAGSQPNTTKLTISVPGVLPEVFDNVPGAGAAVWGNLRDAVNNGRGPLRGPSQLVVASALAGATSGPAYGATYTLVGGTDGAANVTTTMLVGQDGLPRSGMYALRGQGCSIGMLADGDDSGLWITQAGFGVAEGVYMILAMLAGSTVAAAMAAKTASGLDSYAVKLMHGDWVWWNDQANAMKRLVAPQGFVAGRLANLSPEQSPMNKPLYGVIGTQKSGTPGTGQSNTSTTADLAALLGAGIDVIANPQPGGAFWGLRGGHNSSSNAAISGDNYTRLTNFLAATLAAGMGQFVGEVINAQLFARIRATQLSYLQNLLGQGVLGSMDGSLPFSVICDASNNPPSRTGLGYVRSDAQIRYQAINEKFIVNVEGGQTVTVQRQTLPSGQVGGV